MFTASDIPIKLRDNTLRVDVAWYALCIVLRISIGLGLILYNTWLLEKGKWLMWVVIAIMTITSLGFIRKYMFVHPVWKVYLRYVIMALCVIILLYSGLTNMRQDLIVVAGIFIIFDVLMGMSSRYITANMQYI